LHRSNSRPAQRKSLLTRRFPALTRRFPAPFPASQTHPKPLKFQGILLDRPCEDKIHGPLKWRSHMSAMKGMTVAT
jgi:hypothetical protein